MDKDDKLDQGGGIGREPEIRVQFTTRCQHLYISDVQPCLQLVHVQLDIPIRYALNI